MSETTKISVRLTDKALGLVDSFAAAHSMNRTSVIEFFVLQTVREIQKSDAENERMERMESQLKAMQKSNYKALVYLCMTSGKNPENFVEAEKAAEKNITEIFGG